jgi:hypothetical protein
VRESTEWSRESLAGLIGPGYADSALDQYLGVRTWFWGITVTVGGSRLRWIVARVPDEGGKLGEPVFRLLEEEFRP